MPLIFSKTLNVTDVTIDSPQVSLIRGAGGEWNYSSFAAAGQVPSADTGDGSYTLRSRVLFVLRRSVLGPKNRTQEWAHYRGLDGFAEAQHL